MAGRGRGPHLGGEVRVLLVVCRSEMREGKRGGGGIRMPRRALEQL